MAWTHQAGAARSSDMPVPANLRSWEHHESRSAILGMQLGYEQAFDAGKAPASLRDCIDAVDPAALVPFFREIMGRVLTPAEIEQTERFWRSDLGVHYADVLLARFRGRAGVVSPYQPAPLNADEQAQVDKLNGSPAWTKLGEETSRRRDDGELVMKTPMMALVRACTAKGG